MILITGASSGIGEATARAFAHAGKSLVLLARREDRLKQIATELRKQHPGIEVHTLTGDVTDRTAISRIFEREASTLSRITVLLNNAGLARGLAPLQSGRPEDWDEMIDTNIKGLLNITHAVLPLFLKNREGHIVNLGSVAGHFTYPNGNVYCATKYAVRALTESLRLDLHGTGIRVTEISPGMVETEFSQVRLGDAEKARAVYQGMTPLTASDIADTVVWATSRPRHVNIQEIIVYPVDQASPTLVARNSQAGNPSTR